VKIAQYRHELSRAIGRTLLIRRIDDRDPDNWTETDACSERHMQVLTKDLQNLPPSDASLGKLVYAKNPAELEYKVKLTRSAMRVKQYASVFGEVDLLSVSKPSLDNVESTDVFSGEVALVTGAASGIGKACVEALLARGAAVIALDIKPEIVNLFHTPAYLGMQCDLTEPEVTIQCFEMGVRAFGGLDMLVLNAGIFPSSCTLDSMSMEYWRKVMNINLDANITLLREGYALLKSAPRYGRVVINASRNVPAPGPGAAAYSASKSALTQLGRVAALEWGPSHIRVNMLHPHAVFDTGIWTDDVIKSRASKYGLTVEQYKTNNVLGVELSSRDIGELIAEMLGPVFSKTTGAQIPVDGGCDRVI
jgi:NAD(P)-dependent dehydrogenase (short-subunit alcohol dehydrogenase family)